MLFYPPDGSAPIFRPEIVSWDYTISGTKYYVSPTGSDSNPGTLLLPFLTPQHAVDLAVADDAVLFLPGTLTMDSVLDLPHAGTSGHPITLSCAPAADGGYLGCAKLRLSDAWIAANPATPVINGNNTKSYYRINGLEIEGTLGRTGAPAAEHNQCCCILWDQHADGWEVTNNVIHGAIHCGLKGGHLATIHGNVVYDCGTTSTDHAIYDGLDGTLIEGNVLYDCTGYGCHSYNGDTTASPTGQTITKNLIFDCATGCILVSGGSNVVSHNTGDAGGTFGFIYFGRGGANFNTVRDNIFANSGSYDCFVDWGGGADCSIYPHGNVDDHNDYFPLGVSPRLTDPNACRTTNTAANELNADPLFLDPAGTLAGVRDYRLKSTSPCVGSASDGGERGAFPYIAWGLNESFTRKGRLAASAWGLDPAWGANNLEGAAPGYVWQPETLCFRDDTYGSEVWRFTFCAATIVSWWQNDISFPSWSADGQRMALATKRKSKFSAAADQAWVWYTLRADGSYFRPAVNHPHIQGGDFFHWCPQRPNVAIDVGAAQLANGASPSFVYKVTVGDTSIASLALTSWNNTLPPGVATGNQNTLRKMISGDGSTIVIRTQFNSPARHYFTPMRVWPDASAACLVNVAGTNSWAADRSFGNYGDMADAGGVVLPQLTYHDWYPDALGQRMAQIPSQDALRVHNTWFNQTLTGTATDGGPRWTGDSGAHTPAAFGEIIPADQDVTETGNVTSPWCSANNIWVNDGHTTYWSHGCFDRWFVYVMFTSSEVNAPPAPPGVATRYGPEVWNTIAHTLPTTGVPSFGNMESGHNDWHAWSDWNVCIGYAAVGARQNVLRTQRYNLSTSQRAICRTFNALNGDSSLYQDGGHPGQSPDGTKAHFETAALKLSNQCTDCFLGVNYYPYPAVSLDAVTSGVSGQATVRWMPPSYTARRWKSGAQTIDEATGEVLYQREAKLYRLWRSASATGPWTQVGLVAASSVNDAVTNTFFPAFGGVAVGPSNKVRLTDAPGDGTWYYHVSVREHSGIANHNTSDIIRVVVSGASVTSTLQTAGGPPLVQGAGNSQAGLANFYTTKPPAPTALAVADGASAGIRLLSWVAPYDPTGLIRHYNLYSSDVGYPRAAQDRILHSLPADNYGVLATSYVDWTANPSGTTYYGITSVDEFGNESDPTYPSAGDAIDVGPNLWVE